MFRMFRMFSFECLMFLVECSARHHLPLVRTEGVPTAAAAAGALGNKNCEAQVRVRQGLARDGP